MTLPLLRRFVVGLIVLLLMGTIGSIPALADPTTPTPPQPSTSYSLDPSKFALTVTPTRLALTPADLGTTQQISVINRGQAPLPVTVQKRNFIAGADGSLSYSEDAPWAAAAWISLKPAQFTVAPGATQIVTLDITVPPLPEPGDHQVAIVLLVQAGQTSGNVKINRGVGVPMYLTVLGPVDDSVTLSELRGPRFAGGGPVTIAAIVHNVGTVHRDFRGVTRLSVQSAGHGTPFPDFTIPRGAVRDISTTWDPPMMCICHPSVTVTDATGSAQTLTIRVIVFPWLPVTIALAVLLLVIVGVKIARLRYHANVVTAAAALHRADGRGDA